MAIGTAARADQNPPQPTPLALAAQPAGICSFECGDLARQGVVDDPLTLAECWAPAALVCGSSGVLSVEFAPAMGGVVPDPVAVEAKRKITGRYTTHFHMNGQSN